MEGATVLPDLLTALHTWEEGQPVRQLTVTEVLAAMV